MIWVVNLLMLIYFGVVANFVYSGYKEKQPIYRVGQCVQTVIAPRNEFENAEYGMYKILAVGKKHYKMIRFQDNISIETIWPISVFNRDTNIIVECPEELKKGVR